MTVNRIIANHANPVREAILSASAQRGSSDIRLLSQSRQGRGQMRLTGPYTGAGDSEIDVEVIGGAAGAMRATRPVISGVGNGELTVTGIATGAVAETVTFTLLDTGDPAEAAVLDFYGVTIAARAPGQAGNALELTVTRNLTATETQYATLEEIPAETPELVGDEWDWGQPATTAGGIPSTALRFRFAGYPTVHRSWKAWEDGRFVYRLDPAPERDIPADTRIEAVGGDYTLTLTDGATTETYTVVTILDFLREIDARSQLVEVRGTIAEDRAPGGMAVTDIPLRTDAHALPPRRDVRSQWAGALQDISVSPSAPTERVEIKCLGEGSVGAEIWRVEGSVSGRLADAITGQAYSDGPIGFTIPPIDAPLAAQTRISGAVNLTSRDDGEGKPAICFRPLRIGAQASNRRVTFTYTKRPPAECDCSDMTVGQLNDECLGLEDPTMSTLDPEYQSRLEQLYQWRADAVAANTKVATTAAAWEVHATIDRGGLTDYVRPRAVFGFATFAEAETAAREIIAEGAVTSGYANEGAAVTIGTHTGVIAESTAPAVDISGELIATVESTTGVVDPEVRIVEIEAAVSMDAGRNDITWINAATGVLATVLKEIYDVPAAATEWDTLLTEVETDLADLDAQTADDSPDPWTDTAPTFLMRYRSRADYIRSLAGIPPKSDASSQAGDGCWRDDASATHWWVPDDDELAPAFTNAIYHSSRRGCGQNHPEGEWYSTQEFGFGLAIDCPERLKEGDQFTITIRGAGGGSRYEEGDRWTVSTVAAQAAAFGGGEDGDATQTWTVQGSVSGAHPDWLYDPDAPTAYTAGPVAATLAPGGIPWEAGDLIRLAVEGGLLRWRRDGSAWTEGDIYGTSHDLGDGLTLAAQPGSAPSFLPGDSWTYRAVATHGLDRLRQPRIGRAYAWDGDATVIDVDLGGVEPVEAVLIGLHDLPESATVTIAGGDAAPDEWSDTPATVAGPIVSHQLERTARYLRVTVTGAGAGGSIGWLYAGQPWAPTVGASDLALVRQYGLSRGAGLNAAALYRGRGTGGRWSWRLGDGAYLDPATADALLALVDHVAEQGVEPVGLLPDYREPTRAHLAMIDTDAVQMSDEINWQHQGNRAVSVELPFAGVID